MSNSVTKARLFHMGGVPVGGLGYSDGEVFWLDPSSGNDGNYTGVNGTRPDFALASMTFALSLCVDDRGDTIIRLPGSETPSAVVEFNKAGVTVISSALALGYGTNPMEPEKFSTYPAAAYATGPAAIVTAPTALYGLEFVTRNVTSGYTDAMTTSGAALAVAGNAGAYAGGFNHFAFCRFTDWWGNDYGIEFGAGAYNLVEYCNLESFTGGIMFRGTSLRNPQSNVVRRCYFRNCTNGIDHYVGGVTAHDFIYEENTFVDYTDAIDWNNQASDGLCTLNRFETATDLATYDITVAAAQALGINFAGNIYSE